MVLFSEPCFAALMDAAFEGLMVHDGHRIVGANARLAQLFGFESPAEMIGVDHDLLLTAKGHRMTDARVAGGIEGVYRTECRRLDGTVFAVEVHARECRHGGKRARMVAFSPGENRGSDRIAEQARALDSTVRALAETIEQRDSFTAGHQDRVYRVAVQIAERLGVDGRTLDTVRMAANVHDIGKIAIPAEILMKPGALSEGEFELVKGHVRAGYRILESIDFHGPVARAVLEHHERVDGGGYPQGLDDPIAEARILMVADVYDALTSARPYRSGLAAERAIAMMEAGEAGALDGEVLGQLAAVVLSEGDRT